MDRSHGHWFNRVGLIQESTAQHSALPPLAPGALTGSPRSLWWEDGLPLEHLQSLSASQLSGPRVEVKERARSLLQALVVQQQREESLDLRRIDGLHGKPEDADAAPLDIERYAASPACRALRLIGYRDFLRALGQALPQQHRERPTPLSQASWRQRHYYWDSRNAPAAAAAIAYARLRGLAIALRVQVTGYRLDAAATVALREAFQLLALPRSAWSAAALGRELLESQGHYARLTLGAEKTWSVLLLDRHKRQARELGHRLQLGGAVDVAAYLEALSRND